ncbi:hypothetical protein PIB30_062765 [Stylosanthes scabra]|uniref:Uncharacterized protein n=1 Tax=Stylosanthes scabra TaxID=79078 RepID=A0ABU6VM90_9FABA|nr:hypothetical protein [Stylosanthes scabra]
MIESDGQCEKEGETGPETERQLRRRRYRVRSSKSCDGVSVVHEVKTRVRWSRWNLVKHLEAMDTRKVYLDAQWSGGNRLCAS